MAYLCYSTWMLAEHLRLWSDLALRGWAWWPGAGCEARRRHPAVPAGRPAPRAQGPGPAAGHPPEGYFERLVAAAERIVRHAAYPGKSEAVEQCVEEVRDLLALGRITADQAARLFEILAGTCPRVA